MPIRPRDYIVVEDRLFFAVVSDVVEQGRSLAWLRYIKDKQGLHKLTTESANDFIKSNYPEFLWHGEYADVNLHGVPFTCIDQHLKPKETIDRLFALDSPDNKQKDALKLIKRLFDKGISEACLGITGSLMLGCQQRSSDIDVVVYGRPHFFRVQNVIKGLLAAGELLPLDHDAWQSAWQRRDSDLTFDEYLSHELRKYNKCVAGQSKVDISMMHSLQEKRPEQAPYKKLYRTKISAKVVNADYAFDYPACYLLEHDEISSVVAYTATYTGQLLEGEYMEASGYVEEDRQGNKRLLVGTSREATGEYIKLIKHK